jgi:L-aspartate oxidase
MEHTVTNIAIIGAGIAGSWLAYRLAQRGIETVIIQSNTDPDTPRLSGGAAAVIGRRLLESDDNMSSLLVDETGTQHPELLPLVRRYLRQEFDELSQLIEFMPLGPFVIPKSPMPFPRLGAGGEVLSVILDRFVALGGHIIDGRVTHLAVTDGICHGLQYEQHGVPYKLRCNTLVIATGGFSGLLPDAATRNAGALLGMFAQCGGTLSNLEFFYRHAMGDISNGRVLYPPDLEGVRIYRAGSRAVWLEHAYATYPEERRDLDIFQRYWTHNIGVPHVVERGNTSFSLGPIYGFSMGGIAHNHSATNLVNVYTTGEARHDLVTDYQLGRPWACYLATAGMLRDVLSERSGTSYGQDFPMMPVPAQVQSSLIAEVHLRLKEFQDHRFSESGAEKFVEWCRTTRQHLSPEHTGSFQILILAEAYAQSALVRRESRGYFFRADFPSADPEMAQRTTLAYYNADNDRVVVDLLTQQAISDRITSSLFSHAPTINP